MGETTLNRKIFPAVVAGAPAALAATKLAILQQQASGGAPSLSFENFDKLSNFGVLGIVCLVFYKMLTSQLERADKERETHRIDMKDLIQTVSKVVDKNTLVLEKDLERSGQIMVSLEELRNMKFCVHDRDEAFRMIEDLKEQRRTGR